MNAMNDNNYNDKFYDRILYLHDQGHSMDEIREILGNGRQVREALLALEVLQFTKDTSPE